MLPCFSIPVAFFARKAAQPISKGSVPIILLKDHHMWIQGQEILVRPGYARNFLIPKKLAVYSTDKNRELYYQKPDPNILEAKRRERSKLQYAKKLSKLQLKIQRRCQGIESTIYPGIVDEDSISHILKSRHKMMINRDRIFIPQPIQVAGTHTVQVELEGDLIDLKILVIPNLFKPREKATPTDEKSSDLD